MKKISIASILLRIGLAIVFLYAATSSLVDPAAWIGYLPAFLTSFIPANALLTTFSIIQILLSLWLVSGEKTFFASLFSALMLAGIIIPNLALLDIVFRDFAIFFAALALAALSYGG